MTTTISTVVEVVPLAAGIRDGTAVQTEFLLYTPRDAVQTRVLRSGARVSAPRMLVLLPVYLEFYNAGRLLRERSRAPPHTHTVTWVIFPVSMPSPPTPFNRLVYGQLPILV